MITISVEITNLLGIHARTASKIVRTSSKFLSTITAIKDEKKFNLKNVRNVLTINGRKGDKFDIEFEGTDESNAANEIARLFLDKFGEN